MEAISHLHGGSVGGPTYLDGGKALDTLLCAQLLVLLVVTIDVVEWNEGVEAQGGLAEFWSHTLTMLSYELISLCPVFRERGTLTPHHGAVNATMLVA